METVWADDERLEVGGGKREGKFVGEVRGGLCDVRTPPGISLGSQSHLSDWLSSLVWPPRNKTNQN